uniref:Uncharacterized protein n=1 Tax=Globodera rostochiensis TaxID=31243 RepID=A0A914IBL1_GLORO
MENTFLNFSGICCIRLILNGFSIYIGSPAHWEKPVICTPGEPNHQPENHYYTDISVIIIYCCEFLCYTLIWLTVWCKKLLISEVKKLTISLSVFMSIGLICYILNVLIANIIIPLLNLDAFTIAYFVSPISLSLQAMAYGSTAPVLYLCNDEYRNAFRTQFGHQANQLRNDQYRHRSNVDRDNVRRLLTQFGE